MNDSPKRVNQETTPDRFSVFRDMFNDDKSQRDKKPLPDRHPIEEQRNPYTLRCLLTEITNGLAGGNHTKMSHRLISALKESHHHRPGRNYGIGFNRQHLGKVHRDTTHITYYLLEAYAEVLKMPTGILLLFSRLKSIQDNPSKRDIGEINRVMNFLEEIVKRWDEEVDVKFDIDELIKWSNKYETAPYDRAGRTLL